MKNQQQSLADELRVARRGVDSNECNAFNAEESNTLRDILNRAAAALEAQEKALELLARECDRHASHPVSDHRPYFECMAARARAAITRSPKDAGG